MNALYGALMWFGLSAIGILFACCLTRPVRDVAEHRRDDEDQWQAVSKRMPLDVQS